ncbi:MAG: RHS repeat-associated core domain-containing protein, partial [Acidobacteriota bacterium]|nr:RHS repeat-associated core domain-containing protein [Acidobacteriota bacterium]
MSGEAVARHDYLPFGEELGAGVGGRTTAQGYSGTDNMRQKFAGTERDTETGLDFMQARYMSSTQGRFTSTDPLYFQFMMAIDPQRFNLYAYARNNPLKFVDPDGEKIYVRGSGQTLLYDLAGGQEAFDANFQVVNGQVVLRDGVDASKLNAGQQELLGLVQSTDNYLVYAGTDGAEAAALFKGSVDEKGKVTSNGKKRANEFTGNNDARQGGSLVGTTGRDGGALQPANLANGDPVFCVIAYNTGAVFTQTGLGGTGQLTIADALASSSEVGAAQASGLNQVIRPGSFFIHEATENREFSRVGAS